MASAAQKQIRDNALELQDFLKDLKSWEQTIKQKDSQVKSKASSATGPATVPLRASSHTHNQTSELQTKSRRVTGAAVAGLTEPQPDAISEKDVGNQFYKEKKYVKAVESYSRSIALQPTAVAYANRAMAYLKIRRFQEAEGDCNEAVSLDDRYTKAYARRGTARMELENYRDAVADFEFALRLEPENRELQNQYESAKQVYEKVHGIIASEEKARVSFSQAASNVPIPMQGGSLADYKLSQARKLVKETSPQTKSVEARENGGSLVSSVQRPAATFKGDDKKEEETGPSARKTKEAIAATQAAATRAAASAMAGVARSFVAPRTSYEFEALWKSISGSRFSQARLLKMMDPYSLPSLFKESLGASLMIDIIQTLEEFFPDDASLAVQILENLSKVGRFSMTLMCLTLQQKSDLKQLWGGGAFKSEKVSLQVRQQLESLLVTYRLS